MQHHAQMLDERLPPGNSRDGTGGLLPGTRQFSLHLDRPLPAEVQRVVVPSVLSRAVPRRQAQFRAGRYCAMRALEALDAGIDQRHVDRAPSGAPIWPVGVTGSITHTDDFASAAVASTTAVVSLGIDTERIMSEQQAREVGHLVASSMELEHCRAAGIGSPAAVTLVFSAKESIFKCLHPLVGRMFEFDDVRLVGVDAAMQTFRAELMNDTRPRVLRWDPARRTIRNRRSAHPHRRVARNPGLLSVPLNSMRFTRPTVDRFATWSGDRNPLHVDTDFARQTHFGQPIVHGILTVLDSLAEARGEDPRAPAQSL